MKLATIRLLALTLATIVITYSSPAKATTLCQAVITAQDGSTSPQWASPHRYYASIAFTGATPYATIYFFTDTLRDIPRKAVMRMLSTLSGAPEITAPCNHEMTVISDTNPPSIIPGATVVNLNLTPRVVLIP